jgi:hypothetical protein
VKNVAYRATIYERKAKIMTRPLRLSSPLRSLKTKPELIATKFVNLTKETVGEFLNEYGWRIRIRFPESATVPGPLPHDARVLNPDTIR